MKLILYIFLNFLIIGLFLYSKLLPHKDRLNTNYRKVYNFWGAIFNPILNFFKTFMKPFKVGTGLSVDMTQIVLLLLFLVLLKLI